MIRQAYGSRRTTVRLSDRLAVSSARNSRWIFRFCHLARQKSFGCRMAPQGLHGGIECGCSSNSLNSSRELEFNGKRLLAERSLFCGGPVRGSALATRHCCVSGRKGCRKGISFCLGYSAFPWCVWYPISDNALKRCEAQRCRSMNMFATIAGSGTSGS